MVSDALQLAHHRIEGFGVEVALIDLMAGLGGVLGLVLVVLLVLWMVGVFSSAIGPNPA